VLEKVVLGHLLDDAGLLVQGRGGDEEGLQVHALRLVVED